MSLRDRFGVIGEMLFWLIIVLIFSTGIYAFGMWQYSWALPWEKQIERQTIEQSKSFVDSNNNMLETKILEYARLDTKIAEAEGDQNLQNVYIAQQNAIIESMCRQISTMNKSTVNPSTISWLNSKGGCK